MWCWLCWWQDWRKSPMVTVSSWERIWYLGLAKDKQLLLCLQQKQNIFQLQVVVQNYSGWNISWKTIRLMLTVFPSFVIILLSYPHFGPKNTHSNFSAIFWYFQIHRVFAVLQTHILLLLPPILIHSKPFKVFFLHYKPFERVSRTVAYFPPFYSNFCIKSYKRVF